MFGTDCCPRCQSVISAERANSIPKVCDGCGFVMTGNERSNQKNMDRQSLRWIVGVSIAIVLVFMQVVSWGGHSLEVLPMQISGFLGMDSAASQERMAQICLETKKLDCTEDMYVRRALADANLFVRLGKFQFNRMKYAEAAQSLQTYFSRGGTDWDARFVYARALSETGQVDQAAEQFDMILAHKTDVVQVTVMQNYVKLLVQHGRLEQALQVIDSIRKRDESVAMFMDSEYKDIAKKLGKDS